jgi:hypothetical protein
MTFQYPGYLAPLFILFLGLGVWAHRRRQWIKVAAGDQVIRAGFLSRLIIALPLFCWLCVSFMLVTALANPQTRQVLTLLQVQSKTAIMCIDASASMGEGGPHSAMNRIRVMLYDFAQRRLEKGDFVGICAYSGQTNSSRGYGYARVIQYPSRDGEVVQAAVNTVQPSMFGHYSAVGDGVLVSIIALIEPQARQALGDRYDPLLLEDNLWSLGTSEETVEYAQKVAAAIGKQQGRYIVLFTDGKFNTGIDPALALWFAERVGLKVHFIAFESTAATGLPAEEQQRRKERTIEAVRKTGGMYKESVDVAGVSRLLTEIDEAEKISMTVAEKPKLESRQEIFIFGAALAFGLWLCGWLIWSDPL